MKTFLTKKELKIYFPVGSIWQNTDEHNTFVITEHEADGLSYIYDDGYKCFTYYKDILNKEHLDINLMKIKKKKFIMKKPKSIDSSNIELSGYGEDLIKYLIKHGFSDQEATDIIMLGKKQWKSSLSFLARYFPQKK